MKTAILIVGELRSFDLCLPTLHWHLFRHFPGAHFYVSTVADANAPKSGLLSLLYQDKDPGVTVAIEAVPQQPDTQADLRARGANLPEVWQKGAFYTHEPYAISVNPHGVGKQLWQLNRAWEFMISQQTTTHCPYDCVIRVRPDLWFQSCEISYLAELKPTDALSPWWGRFGGINDRFAILGAAAAEAYFTTYKRIPELLQLGCPFHPESLVKGALDLAGVAHRTIKAEFGTLRENGQLREMESGTLGIDLAHLAIDARSP